MEKVKSIEEALNYLHFSGNFVTGIISVAIALCIFRCIVIILLNEDGLKGFFHLCKSVFYGIIIWQIIKVYKTISPDKISLLTFTILIIVGFGFADSFSLFVKETKSLYHNLRGLKDKNK